jgi:hypothetical protein
MDSMEKDVREFIRVTEVLIARLKTGKPMSKNEIMLVQSYSLRTNSLASLLKSYNRLDETRKITSDLRTVADAQAGTLAAQSSEMIATAAKSVEDSHQLIDAAREISKRHREDGPL